MTRRGRDRRHPRVRPINDTIVDLAIADQGDPNLLAQSGILVAAEWAVPTSHEAALIRASLRVPEPARGLMLVDTGATSTSIAIHAARTLGLRPINIVKTFGAHGEKDTPRFYAQCRLYVFDDGRPVVGPVGEFECNGIEGLEELCADLSEQGTETLDVPLVGLLGRDFLKFCKVVYEGPTGSVSIKVDMAGFGS
jgi:hypothetical protein